jgi:predicted RNA-binding Zn ribbon-like protein
MTEQIPQPSGAGRPTAPGALPLVQAFVNTNDLEGGRDQLGTPADLHAWLLQRGLIAPAERVAEEDLRKALAVREGLRALGETNNGLAPDANRIATLNGIASTLPLVVGFDTAGKGDLTPVAAGASGALARLMAIVLEAMQTGAWERVKACRRDACRWLFYDGSKNRSGSWCTMAVCGNKEKARAYRRRRASR